MNDLTTTAGAVTTLGGVAASPLLGLDVNVVLGAFVGASYFILYQKDRHYLEIIALFVISLIGGYVSAGSIASILEAAIETFRVDVDVHRGFGAMIGGVITVNILTIFRERTNAKEVKTLWEARRKDKS